MIDFETLLPDPSLRPFVKMYFWGRDDNPPLAQRVVPNGEMGLMFYRNDNASLDGVQHMRSCIKGQSMRYHDIVARHCIEIVGAHFTVLGARLFFHAPLSEFFEQVVELDNLGDLDLNVLEHQVMDAADHHACWHAIESFFLHRLHSSDADALKFSRTRQAVTYASQHAASAHVTHMAAESCLSTRQLNRTFSDLIGLSPKDFIRLQRYQHALLDLKINRSSTSLAEIAWRNGYYDYSHMSSDFRKLTGFSPTAILSVSKNDGDTVGWRI